MVKKVKQMPASQPLWKVTKVTDVTQFVPGSGAVPSKKIDVELLDGTKTSLTVPDDQFTPQEVQKRINDVATKMINVLALEGPDMSQPQQISDYYTPEGQ